MKVRFALFALALSAAPLAAQGGGNGGGGRGGMRGTQNVDQMATTLTLTADQKKQYQGIVDEYTKMMQPMTDYRRAQMQAGATMPEDSTKKLTTMRTEMNAKLRAVLTADQTKMFDSIAAMPMGGGRRGGGGGR